MEDWGRAYVELGLRMEKAVPGFVDGYYGPPEWKAAVDADAPLSAGALLKAAASLMDALPAQGYAARRQAYLERQVRAMITVCRKLNGEQLTLIEEVQGCYDLTPAWTPEAQFEEARALYEAALPGPGSVAERLRQRSSRLELARDRSDLLAGFMRKALDETRRRTLAFVDLPADEGVEVRTVTGQPWGAYNWYLGNNRSLIELNTDLPTNLSSLLSTMAHEGYPGHHTEHSLKEQLLYRQQGNLENSILLINTPESVISEGIATLAGQMIFAPGEQQAWLAEQIYPLAGVAADPADDAALRRAGELMAGLSGNAALMLHQEGRSEDEVVQYQVRYGLMPEARARKSLEFLKSWGGYIFTYFYGKRLMQPLLEGPGRLDVFRRFLTEQVYPSLLVEWAKER